MDYVHHIILKYGNSGYGVLISFKAGNSKSVKVLKAARLIQWWTDYYTPLDFWIRVLVCTAQST